MGENLQTVRMSDGCAISVKILGDGPGKPLMIAHQGAPGLSTHKEPVAQFGAFADIFNLLVFDMRGGGSSDKQHPYTHKRWVQDIEELRQWAQAEKFVLLGSSYGGFLTLEYILAHPERLHGAIVGDAAAQMSHWGLMSVMKTALTDPRVKPDPEQVLRGFSGKAESLEDLAGGFASVFPLYGVPDHLKAEAEVDIGAALEGATIPFYETHNAAMGDAISRFDVRDRLHEIDLPVLVYVGRYDWVCPVKLSEEVAAGIKNSKLIVYEKSGHMPALEQHSKFQKDAREFLKSLNL